MSDDLVGTALDEAVAVAEGWTYGPIPRDFPPRFRNIDGPVWMLNRDNVIQVAGAAPQFSTNWGLAGPIIERERIELIPQGVVIEGHEDALWCATIGNGDIGEYGPTAIVAAMRVYVTSKR